MGAWEELFTPLSFILLPCNIKWIVVPTWLVLIIKWYGTIKCLAQHRKKVISLFIYLLRFFGLPHPQPHWNVSSGNARSLSCLFTAISPAPRTIPRSQVHHGAICWMAVSVNDMWVSHSVFKPLQASQFPTEVEVPILLAWSLNILDTQQILVPCPFHCQPQPLAWEWDPLAISALELDDSDKDGTHISNGNLSLSHAHIQPCCKQRQS